MVEGRASPDNGNFQTEEEEAVQQTVVVFAASGYASASSLQKNPNIHAKDAGDG